MNKLVKTLRIENIFSSQKGNIFITDEETNKEVFVFVSCLIDKVNTDNKVSFVVIEDKREDKCKKNRRYKRRTNSFC